ncbi:MAG: DsbA family oxidoreductase [Burkholderiales bacterium]
MDTPPPTSRNVDVVSDVVCPWCYIGKRQLEAAIARLPEDERPVVRWHPFQLNPDLPPEGVDRRAYLEAKFGGAERAAQIYERVRAAGRTAGLELAIDRIERQPNTLDAHRLIAWAQSDPSRDATAMVEALFRAYFVEGRPVGERDALARLAGEAGYDAQAAREMLASDTGSAEIQAMDRHAREMGITGVPFFVFDSKVGISGAAGTDTLLDAMTQARDRA